MNFRRGVGEGLAAVGGYQSWLEGMRVEKPVFSREIENRIEIIPLHRRPSVFR